MRCPLGPKESCFLQCNHCSLVNHSREPTTQKRECNNRDVPGRRTERTQMRLHQPEKGRLNIIPDQIPCWYNKKLIPKHVPNFQSGTPIFIHLPQRLTTMPRPKALSVSSNCLTCRLFSWWLFKEFPFFITWSKKTLHQKQRLQVDKVFPPNAGGSWKAQQRTGTDHAVLF